ncbi:MAG: hypothetical protein R3C97_08365 [Geminicoccaceae bacterium]
MATARSAAKLNKAELQPVGPVAHELRVDRDERFLAQPGANLGNAGAFLNERHESTSEIPAEPACGLMRAAVTELRRLTARRPS